MTERAVEGMSSVAFIGAGVMGRPMIANLRKSGFSVKAFDLSPVAVENLRSDGVEVAETLADAVEGVDAIVTMLPDTPHVQSVLLGDGGIGNILPSGMLVIDMSTISASGIQAIGEQLAKNGVELLDAPVSGGVKGAIGGTLSIMCGGSDVAFERAQPVLSAMGTTITHAGKLGMGQVFKMCNQLMVGVHIQAMCEAFALCRAQGADLDLLRNTLMGGAAASWMLENLGPQVIAKDDSAGFRIDLQLKDLRLAGEAAFEKGLALPGLAMATALYLEARAHGEGSNGNQAMFRTYDRLTNQE
ncbi:2-hydroxy-3-oxopropionate reductase [Cohaesibacter marisflavi]|uniref:2-hydroxy-3-oxopropionate reductase n=1 Tax=Cohaesibacter marisflavi TaxID=655353 RepID=A0A1I5JAF6_9HYPH|nr:NAD(P)-dependent oxidoreductase [Cohaesibacter marisflavi]SFO69737.1 2-hydroxy-3-oxopropionate reductase [Cohaesibacter marisflavi]